MPSLIYSPHFVLGFPGLRYLHPFDNYRCSRTYEYLCKQFGFPKKPVDGFVTSGGFTLRVPDHKATDDELLIVHDQAYLKSLRRSATMAAAIEVVPFALAPRAFLDWAFLTPKRWAVSGTLLGAREALKNGLAFSLSGGFHHAKRDRGEGFCILNDIAFAIKTLQAESLVEKVIYVDLDAHQGNGVTEIFMDDPSVKMFDMFNGDIYPYEEESFRARIDAAFPLPMETESKIYLDLLHTHLPRFLDQHNDAKLLIYNAGNDVVIDDQLGGLCLSQAEVVQRDLFVIEQARARKIPLLFLPSGGYTPFSYRLIGETIVGACRG